MQQIIQALNSCGLFLFAGVIGQLLSSRLSERHRDADTLEFLRLAVSVLVAFLAIVLGLLTASAKSHFDNVGDSYRHLATELVQLDHFLREFGSPQTASVRTDMRSYLGAVIFSTWPAEPKPSGTFPIGLQAGQSESLKLTILLGDVEQRLRSLQPATPMQTQLLPDILDTYTGFINARWAVIENGHPTMPQPFYDLMLAWTSLMFLGFGLSAPRNYVVVVTVIICAVSLASVIYVILELDDPIGGLIVVSSDPMREALADLDLP